MRDRSRTRLTAGRKVPQNPSRIEGCGRELTVSADTTPGHSSHCLGKMVQYQVQGRAGSLRDQHTCLRSHAQEDLAHRPALLFEQTWKEEATEASACGRDREQRGFIGVTQSETKQILAQLNDLRMVTRKHA